MKRIFLFLLTNVLVVVSISVLVNVLGLNKYLTPYGVNQTVLIGFCLVWGMAGSFISLFLSKWTAKRIYNIQLLNERSRSSDERILVDMVYSIAKKAGIKKMPEVGLYESPEINAFATGWSKNNSLVAFSTGLISSMNRDEIEGVISHEIAHVQNGDMVTLTLIQGVLNAFVMFLSRTLASVLSRNENGSRSMGMYYVIQILSEIVLMLFATILVAFFSRIREFSADRDGAKLVGKEKMIAALEALQRDFPIAKQVEAPAQLKAMRISDYSLVSLFSTHPSLEKRIKRLRSGN